MRSGAMAKLKVEKIRLQRMSVKKLVVESLVRDRKDDRKHCMVTPWRRKMVGDSGHYLRFPLSEQVILRRVVRLGTVILGALTKNLHLFVGSSSAAAVG